MQPDDYIEANRRMWNETAEVHDRGYVNGLREQVQSPEFSTFDEVERRLLGEIGLEGKAVIQLACNNGRELISIKKSGAGRCVGVDVSDGFIAQAKELARLGAADVEFLRLSVYDLPPDLDGQFDLVYITIGALGWLPDLDSFFAIVSRLMRPSGQLFIYEMHPVLNMFNPDNGLVVEASFSRRSPL